MTSRDIRGALGTIRHDDADVRRGWRAHLRTFFAILGPGLIVMVGDNDAGAFGTYTQAGQDYGTTLLWTLVLLAPVLYVNQEMVLRLGVVSGIGHARLIFARFGRFWGAFSIIDLFVLNALTIVTEFIGISLATEYLGVPKIAGVGIAAALVIAVAGTGDFRTFERFALLLCGGSLLLLPVLVAAHTPLGSSIHDLFIPALPGGDPTAVLLLIIAIVGTTVAPWQLFFQQSYVIDKQITPRYMTYERWDLVVGIGFVLFGAIAMISFCAATFGGHREFGAYQDAGAVATGIATYVGRLPAACFALALLDASIIGAAAVSLSTAYALGDVLPYGHSLHRKVSDAPQFYVVYAGLIIIAATIVLAPGSPLGLLTNAVQTLAGILLPSATVFLLLLSNDRAVMGPWVNSNRLNVVAAIVIGVLVMLSVVLTASVLVPGLDSRAILWILIAGGVGSAAVGVWVALGRPEGRADKARSEALRETWRMPPLEKLPKAPLTPLHRFWLVLLRAYLVVAAVLVVVRVTQIALGHHG